MVQKVTKSVEGTQRTSHKWAICADFLTRFRWKMIASDGKHSKCLVAGSTNYDDFRLGTAPRLLGATEQTWYLGVLAHRAFFEYHHQKIIRLAADCQGEVTVLRPSILMKFLVRAGTSIFKGLRLTTSEKMRHFLQTEMVCSCRQPQRSYR